MKPQQFLLKAPRFVRKTALLKHSAPHPHPDRNQPEKQNEQKIQFISKFYPLILQISNKISAVKVQQELLVM